MDLSFTPEQEQLRSSVNKMLQRHAGQAQGNLSGREVQADLVDMAVLQLALVDEDSGVEDALTSVVAVLEELGRYRVAELFLSRFLGARLLAPAIAGRTEEIDGCLSTPAQWPSMSLARDIPLKPRRLRRKREKPGICLTAPRWRLQRVERLKDTLFPRE